MTLHLCLVKRAGSIGVGVLVALATAGLSVTLAFAPALHVSTRLLATYLLKPTQVVIRYPDSYVLDIASPYLDATVGAPPAPVSVVNYPASLFPLSPGYLSDPTFDQSVAAGVVAVTRDASGDPAPVIFGYSQGVTVATEYKRNLIAARTAPAVRFVFIGNPNRPNGGVLSRFPGLYIPGFDITANGPTPTQTPGTATGVATTDDYARQYDFFADYPTNPLNLVALANAIAGLLTHIDYISVGPRDAILQDQYGDTRYHLIPTTRLPLLAPLALFVPSPILAAIDAPLRVIVEAGYDRTINPGAPTSARLGYGPDPAAFAADFLRAIPTGWDDALADVGLGRPFGTAAAGAYGVGGPPVPLRSTPQREQVSRPGTELSALATPVVSPTTASATQPLATTGSVTESGGATAESRSRQQPISPPPAPSASPMPAGASAGNTGTEESATGPVRRPSVSSTESETSDTEPSNHPFAGESPPAKVIEQRPSVKTARTAPSGDSNVIATRPGQSTESRSDQEAQPRTSTKSTTRPRVEGPGGRPGARDDQHNATSPSAAA